MKNMKLTSELRSSEAGATMLEFAIAGSLLLFLAITFIDLSRVFFVQYLLTKGAQEGVSLATTIADLDPDNEKLPTTDVDIYDKFVAAREEVADVATARVLDWVATLESVDPDASVVLLAHSPIDYLESTQQTTPDTAALVLRPGDSALDARGFTMHHPLRCSTLQASCLTPRNTWDTMDVMLGAHPIVVRLEAVVKTFSPWLANIPLRGDAMGWREVAVESGFNEGRATPEELNEEKTTPIPVPDDCSTPQACAVGYRWYEFDSENCECVCDEQPCPPGQTWAWGSCACLGSGGT